VTWTLIAKGAEDYTEVEAMLHQNNAIRGTYYVIGSFNNWSMQEMVTDEFVQGVFCIDVQLNSDGGEFQIVRNRDFSQVFHPAAAHVIGSDAQTVVGPDDEGYGLHWHFDGHRGDVYHVEFQRTTNLGRESRSVTWNLKSTGTCETGGFRPLYFIIGSWNKWRYMHCMDFDGTSHHCKVNVGPFGQERFQIVVGGDIERRLYPSIPDATLDGDFHVLGPDNLEENHHWMIRSGPPLNGTVRCFNVHLRASEDGPVVSWS